MLALRSGLKYVLEVLFGLQTLSTDDYRNIVQSTSNGMLIIAAFVFVSLFFTNAPYGKFSPSGLSAWGPPLNAKLAWFLQEIPAFLLPILICLKFQKLPSSIHGCVLLGMFLIHYFQRALVYPFLLRGGKPTPLFVCSMAFIFCTVNGTLQGLQLVLFDNFDGVNTNIFALGVAMWLFGLSGNIYSDHLLRNLRKPGESGYKIPYGGLYGYVSCPNYLCEIIEWLGFAVAAASLPALAFAVFTFCNLFPRALDQHRFYKSKFDNYPKHRRAIIPFIL